MLRSPSETITRALSAVRGSRNMLLAAICGASTTLGAAALYGSQALASNLDTTAAVRPGDLIKIDSDSFLNNMPMIRAGGWERKEADHGVLGPMPMNREQTLRVCRIRKPLNPRSLIGDGASCTTSGDPANGYMADCHTGGSLPGVTITLSLHATMEGDFSKHFVVTGHLTGTTNGQPDTDLTEVRVWTYVGACDRGQWPQ